MPLCRFCAAFNWSLTDLLSGDAKPWGRTTSDVEACAGICDLCAVVVAARRETWQPNEPLTIVGRHNAGELDISEASPSGLLWIVGIYPMDALNETASDLRRGRKDKKNEGVTVYHRSMDNARAVLSVVCDLDAPLSLLNQITGRPIKPADDTTRVKAWFEDCKENHPACGQVLPGHDQTSMPTRLVDVGEGGRSLRLIEVAGNPTKYLALSHRWGGAKIIMTTQANLESHKVRIAFDELSTTFRDAVIMTSRLGYRYIWIDSLCIIQDSADDWASEAARMATVYMNAEITLAAACATSGDTGLFHERLGSVVRIPCPEADDTGRAGFYLTKRRAGAFQQEVNNGPLNSRAWCLQERWLSRRILHFGHTQRFWECQEVTLEESSREPGSRYDRFGGSGYLKSLSEYSWSNASAPTERGMMYRSEFSSWYMLVGDYCNRDMTVLGDKLPALSGLASVFAKRRKDRYLAGLWEADLASGLLWCSRGGGGLSRPETFRAPSWSWAALDGRIAVEDGWDGKVEIDVVAASTTLAGADPYGKVTAGFVEVSGILEVVRVGSPVTQIASTFQWSNVNASLLSGDGEFIGEASLDHPQEMTENGQLFCLMVFRADVGFRPFARDVLEARGDWAWCLLLECLGDRYKRVGLAEVYQSAFKAGVKAALTIV